MQEKPHKKAGSLAKAVDLVVGVYQTTSSLPVEERYGLTAQLQRAAISVLSNIAEGVARGSNRFFMNALYFAGESLSELDTQLVIAHRLGYLDEQETARLGQRIAEVDRMLNGLIASVRRKAAAATASIGVLLGVIGWVL